MLTLQPGTPAFNKELSLKRAQAVKNALVKNYGIAADRLNVEVGGGVTNLVNRS